MKKGSTVVVLGLFALLGLAFASSSSASAKPRAPWRKFRVEYLPSQEPAVSTFLEELEAFGEVGNMHFGDDLVIDFRGAPAEIEKLAARYGFTVGESS